MVFEIQTVPVLSHCFGQKLDVFIGQKKELWVVSTVFHTQVYIHLFCE